MNKCLLIVALGIILPSCLFAREKMERTIYVDDLNGTRLIHETTDHLTPFDDYYLELDDPSLLWQVTYENPICQTSAVAGNDFVAVGCGLNNSTADIFDTWGEGEPLFSINVGEGRVAAAGDLPLLALLNFNGDYNNPSTEVSVFDLAAPDPEIPQGTATLAGGQFTGDHPIDFCRDGSRFAFGFAQPAEQLYMVKVFDGSTCEEIESFMPPLPNPAGVRNVVMSSDGELCAAIFGPTLFVWEVGGDILWQHDMGFSNDALGMSGDGSIVAYGWNDAYAYRWNPDAEDYELLTVLNGDGYCGEVAVSDDGSTIASAWYSSNYNENALYLHDANSNQQIWNYHYPVTNGISQDLPVDLDISADGRWIVVGAWGDSDSDREIACFDKYAGPGPYFIQDMTGSVFDVDMAPNGNIVAGCGKHVHANQMGRGGDLAVIHLDTPDYFGPTRWAYLSAGDQVVRQNMLDGYLDTLQAIDNPQAIAISRDGFHLYITGMNGEETGLFHYDPLRDETQLLTEFGDGAIAVSPNDSMIYFSDDGIVMAWSLFWEDIEPFELEAASDPMVIAVKPDGSPMVLCEEGQVYTAPLGDLENWQLIYTIPDPNPDNMAISIHPSGLVSYLLSGNSIYSIHPGDQVVMTDLPEEFAFSGLACEPNGSRLFLLANVDGLQSIVSYNLDGDGIIEGEPNTLWEFEDEMEILEGDLLDITLDNGLLVGKTELGLFGYNPAEDDLIYDYENDIEVDDLALDNHHVPLPVYHSFPETNVVFGMVQVGDFADRTVTVENTGGGFLWLTDLARELLPEYTFIQGGNFPEPVQSGIPYELVIRFEPEHAGTYADTLFIRTADGEIHQVHLFAAAQGGPQEPELRVPLQENYFELVSTNLVPEDPDASVVFGNVDGLSIVYADDGGIFIPPAINTIADIVIPEGYRVFCSQASEWVISGPLIDPETLYSLDGGRWNWIGYPFDHNVPVEIALQEISDIAAIVMADDGRIWLPDAINTIGDLEQGMGYLVFASEDVDFLYHDGVVAAGTSQNRDLAVSGYDNLATGLPYAVIITMDDNVISRQPESIELFDEDLLVGRKVLTSEETTADSPLPVIAWEGNAERNIPGFKAGDPVTVTVRNSSGDEILSFRNETTLYGKAPYAMIHLEDPEAASLPDGFSLGEAYPNPFNPVVTVPFTLPQTGEITFILHNALGQKVFSHSAIFGAGTHRFVFDANSADGELGTGLYFLQVIFQGQKESRKLIYLR